MKNWQFFLLASLITVAPLMPPLFAAFIGLAFFLLAVYTTGETK